MTTTAAPIGGVIGYRLTITPLFPAEGGAKFGKELFNWLNQRGNVAYRAALAKLLKNNNSDIVQEFIKIKRLDSASLPLYKPCPCKAPL